MGELGVIKSPARGTTSVGAARHPPYVMHTCGHAREPACKAQEVSESRAPAADATVSLSVRVPADLRRRLRVYAAEHGTSAQDCVQDALTTWLDRRTTHGEGT